MNPGRNDSLRVLIVLAIVVALMSGAPPPARAAHDNSTGSGTGLECYDCHTLSSDPDIGALAETSDIQKQTRTIQTMLLRGFTPNYLAKNDFACTFCHSSPNVHPGYPASTTMKPVLNHFDNQSYKHPVWEAYLSSAIDVNAVGHLGCTGCHDPTIVTVPEHNAAWRADKSGNPYALRDPGAAGNVTTPAGVNEFCGALCHLLGSPGGEIIDSGRNQHSASTAPTTVRGIDVTKVDCQDCHKAHYSDQDDLIPTTVASPSQCRNCHKSAEYVGGAAVGTDGTNYYTGGHGKVRATTVNGGAGGTIAMACDECHSTSIAHDFNVENRLPWDEVSDQCWTCHGTSKDHIVGGNTLLCLDCHDPHGDGTGTNMWMIKSPIQTPNSGSQAVVLTARTGANSFDDGALNPAENSVCSVCHSEAEGTTHNNNTTDGVNHADGINYEGTNCVAVCHTHASNPGFFQDCDNCHGYPPNLPPGTVSSQSAGGHAIHSNAPYSFQCASCHTGYVHRNFAINVGFDAQNPSAGAYTPAPGVGDTCDNLNCHNPYRVDVGTNPELTATTNNPNWLATNATGCAFCHTKTSGSHTPHLTYIANNLPTVTNPCTVCHETWADTVDHVKGTIDDVGLVDFSATAGPVNLSAAVVSSDGAGFGMVCANVYCHGNYIPGGYNESPVWGDAGSGQCGDCHAALPDTGAHTLHLSGASGPQASCTECHGANAASGTHLTHVNGVVDVAGATLAATTTCNGCHGNDANGKNNVDDGGTGDDNEESRLAKYFWSSAPGTWFASSSPIGTYLANGDSTIAGGSTYCLMCHDGTDGSVASVINTTAGTGGVAITAPDIKGNAWIGMNGTTINPATNAYGARASGHSRSTGSYESGLAAASRSCGVCHAEGAAHIDGADGAGFAAHRLDSTVNGVPTSSSVDGVCYACHQNGVGTQVSDHDNAYATPIEGDMAVQTCSVCHEVHGLVSTGTDVNWWMFRYDLPTPAGTRNVVLTFRTGDNSFDELTGDTVNADNYDDACAACHLSAVGASTLVNHDITPPMGGGIHEGTTAYTGDDRGKNCLLCHKHDNDGTAATADGFTPRCDGCHGNPPATGAHLVHVNDYGYLCVDCHYNYNHNPGGLTSMVGYSRAQVEVAFDPAGFNSDGNNGVLPAPTHADNATTDLLTCSNLACHNPDAFTVKATVTAPGNIPVWGADNTSCTWCHLVSPSGFGESHYEHDNPAAPGGYGYACTYCHNAFSVADGAAAPATHGRLTLTTTGVVSFGGTLGGETLAGAYDDGTRACTGVYCHGGTAKLTSSGAMETPVWNSPTTAQCGDCHGAKDGVSVSTWPTTLAHPKHAGTAADQRNLACADCHNGVPHANGWSTVAFSATIAGWNAAVETYGGTPGVGNNGAEVTDTCGNLYCHSDMTAQEAGFMPVQWDAGALDCGSCHAAGGASATHADHTGAAAKNYACSVCHSGFGDDLVTHADHLVQNAFTTNWNSHDLSATVYVGGTTAPFDAYGTCSAALYCHGNFTGGNLANTATWGGTAACGTCHTATPATGSHGTHFNTTYGPSAACGSCHNGNTLADAGHVNGAVSFRNTAADPTPVLVAATGICDSCHGNSSGTYDAYVTGTVKPNWTTESVGDYSDITCVSCHGQYALSTATESGGTVAPEAYDNFATAGHGRTTAFPQTGNPAPSYVCLTCHDTGATDHISGALGDEDRLQGVLTRLTACADCHAPDQSAGGPVLGLDATVEASNHSTTVTGNYAGVPGDVGIAYDYTCVVCHNPHGTSNIAMINTIIDDNRGDPAGGVTLLLETGLDPDDLDDNGVCDRCHTNLDTRAHVETNHPTNHNYGVNCLDCHSHEQSFLGSCAGCHGNNDAADETIWPDGIDSNNGTSRSPYADDAGSHVNHITAIMLKEGWGVVPADINTLSTDVQKLICAYCHPAPGSVGHDLNTAGSPASQADVLGDLFVGGTQGRVDGSPDQTRTLDAGTLPPSYNLTTKVCSNSDCHYEKPTPDVVNGWDDGGAATCSTCHLTTATYVAGNLPNAHDAHVRPTPAIRSNPGGMGYLCTQCHVDNGTDVRHLNARVDLSFTATFGEPGGTPASTDAAPIVPVKYGAAGTYVTCSNFYCHGADLDAPVASPLPIDRTPIWNDWTTGSCQNGACHGAYGGPYNYTNGDAMPQIDTGSHAIHYLKYNPGGASRVAIVDRGPRMSTGAGDTHGQCDQCHSASTGASNCNFCHVDSGVAAFPSLGHVDGQVDFQLGTYPYDYYDGGTTLAATPVCNTCHSAGTANAKNLTNWNNTSYRLACLGCHDSTDPANSRYSNTGVDAPPKSANWATAGHGKVTDGAYGGSQCADCHAEESLHVDHAAGENRLDTVGGQTYAAATPDAYCNVCHPTAVSEHRLNTYTSGNASYDGNRCNICHDPHGLAGFDAMIVGTIGAETVTGFTDNTARSSYWKADTSGVCQVCHDPAEVLHFNRTTGENVTHNNEVGANCITCHTHTSTVAFSITCNDCHGSAGDNWPTGSTRVGQAADRAGAHQAHVDYIDTVNGAETKNDSCDWCHPAPAHVGEQANDPADLSQDGTNMTTHFKTQTGADDSGDSYNPVTETCLGINCHANIETPGWYGGGAPSTAPPVTSNVLVNGAASIAITQGTAVDLTASVSDTAGGGHAVTQAEYFLDTVGSDGSGTALQATDGAFDTATEAVRLLGISTAGWSRGVHTVYVHGADGTDGWGPHATAQVTIGDVLTVTRTDLATATVYPGNTYTMERIDAVAGSNTTTITTMTIADNGSAVAGTDVTMVAVYLDADGNDTFSATADTMIGSALFTDPIVLDVADTVVDAVGKSFFIRYTIGSGAVDGRTAIASLTGIGVETGDAVSGLPLTSGTSTISANGIVIYHPSGLGSGGTVGTWTCSSWPNNLDSTDGTNAQATTGNATADLALDAPSGMTQTITSVDACTVFTAAANRDPSITVFISGTQTTTGWVVLNGGGTADTLLCATGLAGPGGNWDWTEVTNTTVRLRTNATATTSTFNEVFLRVNYSNAVTAPPVTYDVLAGGVTNLSVQKGSPFTLTATVSDTAGGNHVITQAEYFVDTLGADGAGTAMSASDGSFNTATEGVTASVGTGSLSLGAHTLYVHGRDGTNGWGPAASVTVTVYDADTVTLAASSVAPGSVPPGGVAAVLKLDFTVDTNGGGQASINTVRIDKAGTAPDGDVSQVAIYADDGDATYDAGDTLVGTGTFSVGTVTLDITDQSVVNPSTRTLFAVLTLASTAATGNTIGATVDDSYITLVAPDLMAATAPVTSSLATIQLPGGIACGDCHTTPPVTGAHVLHQVGGANGDYTDCIRCHTDNGDQYASYYGGTHNNGLATFAAGIATGGTAPDYTCTGACHGSTVADGSWSDTALNCDSCHGNAPATGEHDLHTAPTAAGHELAMACAGCHDGFDPGVNGQGGLLHPSADVGGDANIIADKAQALAGETSISDSGYNGGSSTWNGTNKTCANVYCHNPSPAGAKVADWDAGSAIADCTFCHAASPATGSHSAHTGASGTFGINTITCATCHPSVAAGNYDHITEGTGADGKVEFSTARMPAGAYTAGKETLLPTLDFGSCGTNSCHNRGDGATAPYNGDGVSGYTWGTPIAPNCSTCHQDSPPTGSHDTHLDAVAYGPHPAGSTNCGECHAANANNTSMGGYATHLDETKTFKTSSASPNPPVVLGSSNICNNCHGIVTYDANETTPPGNPLDIKTNWADAAANTYEPGSGNPDVSCESCHGGGDMAAWQNVDASGARAPSRAGTNFTTYGHGKVTDNPTYGGKQCIDCHGEAMTHLSGAPGDNRLNTVNGQDYATAANAFCNVCHATSLPVHYDNTQTAGGASDNGDYCYLCHDPHGQSGYATMVAGTVQGRTVVGFTDKTLRASYWEPAAAYNGICQVCHDPAEVSHFNRATQEDATHFAASGNCLVCHGHNKSTAFAPAGTSCDGCHGNPPLTGAHALHNIVTLQTTAEDRTDCARCHTGADSYTYDPAADRGASLNHGDSTGRDTILATTVGYGNEATNHDGYCGAAGMCHASVAADGRWNDTALDCNACHYWGSPPNATTNTAGSTFRVISELSHDKHFAMGGRQAQCTDCHADHGSDGGGAGVGLTHFTYSTAGTDLQEIQDKAIPTQEQADVVATAWIADLVNDWNDGGNTCTNMCHDPSADNHVTTAWGVANPSGCTFCHDTTAGVGLLDSGSHVSHLTKSATYGGSVTCTTCHPNNGTTNGHMTGSVELPGLASLIYGGGGNLAAPYGSPYGTCSTTTCHQDGLGTPVPSSVWGVAIGDPNCSICHLSSPSTGSHDTHLDAVAYGPHPAGSTNCGECHAANANNTSMGSYATHFNGSATFKTSSGNTAPVVLGSSNICNNCHGITTYDAETIKVEWASQSVGDYTDVTCESCHGGGDMAAWQNVDASGARAENQMVSYATQGHGLPSGSNYPWSGRAGAQTACVTCHDEASTHFNAGVSDRLGTSGNALCNGCHDGPVGAGAADTQVSTHANTSTTMAGTYTKLRPTFELNCIECHNVHGTTNIYMVNTVNANGPLVATRWYNNTENQFTTWLYGGTVAFTDDTLGSDWVNTTGGSTTKICQTCHTVTLYYSQTVGANTHGTSDCLACHGHDIDGDFTAGSQDGFMPAGDCYSCHGGADGTSVHLGIDTGGGPGSGDDAPSVTTYWSGTLADRVDGGHGDPQAARTVTCDGDTGCHSTGGTHMNGTYNSIWNNSTRNTNTAHLKAEYFTQYPPVGSGSWNIQVYFDNYCTSKCHAADIGHEMRHERDSAGEIPGPADSNHNSVEMGTHLTYPDGDARSYPMDCDLNTDANPADTDYAPCVACHDPHGTGVADTSGSPGRNHMMRANWKSISTLCVQCHN